MEEFLFPREIFTDIPGRIVESSLGRIETINYESFPERILGGNPLKVFFYKFPKKCFKTVLKGEFFVQFFGRISGKRI